MRRRPAYARALAQARDRGEHPHKVVVLYGDDWSWRSRSAPTLCVKSGYRSGGLDWGVVAGVPVEIMQACSTDPGPLVGDIARVAAPVTLLWRAADTHWPLPSGSVQQDDASWLAHAARSGVRWPRWWSDSLEADYRERESAYHLALVEDVGVAA